MFSRMPVPPRSCGSGADAGFRSSGRTWRNGDSAWKQADYAGHTRTQYRAGLQNTRQRQESPLQALRTHSSECAHALCTRPACAGVSLCEGRGPALTWPQEPPLMPFTPAEGWGLGLGSSLSCKNQFIMNPGQRSYVTDWRLHRQIRSKLKIDSPR